MTRSYIARQHRPQVIKQQDKLAKKSTAAEPKNESLSHQDLQLLTPETLLQLQRTIGNHAVQREIGDGTTVAPPARPATGPTPRVPPKAPNLPSPGTILPWVQFHRRILDSASNPVQIRAGANPAAANAATLSQRRDAVLDPLKTVYTDFDADSTSLAKLVKLYHKIDHWYVMYWDHDSLRKAGLRTAGIQALFTTTKTSIERKIRNDTARNGADPADVATALGDGGKKGKAPQKIAFFEDVGVPIGFYGNLNKKQVSLFKELYDALAKNTAKKIPQIIAKLTAANIVGFPIIKGLFLTRFPSATGIANLQDADYVSSKATKEQAYGSAIKIHNMFSTPYTNEEMDAEDYAGDNTSKRQDLENNLGGKTVSKNLTNAELAALSDYTGGGFSPANKMLRDNDGSSPDDPNAKQMFDSAHSKNEVIVSALNKLPAYNGIAYRMQNGWADFDAAVKPGGMFADLAFMSASMTAEGAEKGGASGGAGNAGALEVFEMIHTKSASKVTILSNISQETEVLFRPGVRFQVKAIWAYVNGKIPKDAPMEAQMILLRNGPTKTRTIATAGGGTYTGNVRVVELVEV